MENVTQGGQIPSSPINRDYNDLIPANLEGAGLRRSKQARLFFVEPSHQSSSCCVWSH